MHRQINPYSRRGDDFMSCEINIKIMAIAKHPAVIIISLIDNLFFICLPEKYVHLFREALLGSFTCNAKDIFVRLHGDFPRLRRSFWRFSQIEKCRQHAVACKTASSGCGLFRPR
jgi:hypothetical protein